MFAQHYAQAGYGAGVPPTQVGAAPELPPATPLPGKVKAWMEDKGFGFITPDNGGPDVFVHRNQLSDGQSLATGASVTFECRLNPARGKYEATTCSGAAGSPSSAPSLGAPPAAASPGVSGVPAFPGYQGLQGIPAAAAAADKGGYWKMPGKGGPMLDNRYTPYGAFDGTYGAAGQAFLQGATAAPGQPAGTNPQLSEATLAAALMQLMPGSQGVAMQPGFPGLGGGVGGYQAGMGATDASQAAAGFAGWPGAALAQQLMPSVSQMAGQMGATGQQFVGQTFTSQPVMGQVFAGQPATGQAPLSQPLAAGQALSAQPDAGQSAAGAAPAAASGTTAACPGAPDSMTTPASVVEAAHPTQGTAASAGVATAGCPAAAAPVAATPEAAAAQVAAVPVAAAPVAATPGSSYPVGGDAAPAAGGQGQSPASGQWMQATDPNSGRPYYYHSTTREVRWDKPVEQG